MKDKDEAWPPPPERDAAPPTHQPGPSVDARLLRPALALTSVLGSLPFLPYSLSRLCGSLPSESQWQRQLHGEAQHGPLYGSPYGVILDLPLLCLSLLAVCCLSLGIAAALARRRVAYAAFWLALCSAQILLVWAQSGLYWLFD